LESKEAQDVGTTTSEEKITYNPHASVIEDAPNQNGFGFPLFNFAPAGRITALF
jgi:hypothetical protein